MPGFEELTANADTSVFTEEDRRSHTSKMVERTFGVPVEQLGELVMVEDRARVAIKLGDTTYQLHWRRVSRGAPQWYIDDDPTPLPLAGGNNPLMRLRQILDNR